MTVPHVGHALGFERDFAFCEDQDTLGIENQGRVNRSLLTQERIGRTSYSAYIRHVQYGTYQDKPACLVGIDFSFRFPSKSNSRFTYAEVEVTFEHALDPQSPSRRSTDASLDPVVANFAPKHIHGQVTERENEKAFDIEVPVAFEFPFGSAGITAKWSTKTSMTQTGRLEVNGELAQDDEHDDGANSITWDLTENPISKEGILRSFRGAAVLFCRPGKPFWMHASVKPVVSFSLDPRRVLTKRLIGTGDEPVLLDGHTTLGSSSCLAYAQFDAEEFPWSEILNFPKSLGSATP